MFHSAGLTSDDGQLGIDSDFTLCVLGNTFIDVLITWRSKGLDSEYGAGTLVKLNGLVNKRDKINNKAWLHRWILMAIVPTLNLSKHKY